MIDAYELLSNTEDQELFYDYLIANLKLYFDKFENELAAQVDEPTNQAYQDAVADEEGMEAEVAGEEEIELELWEENDKKFKKELDNQKQERYTSIEG